MQPATSLTRLADALGIAAGYVDFTGAQRPVAVEALAAVIEGLGVPSDDPVAGLREYERVQWSDVVDPVAVAWEGRGALLVRTPRSARVARIEVELMDEAGAVRTWATGLGEARVVQRAGAQGMEGGAGGLGVARRVPLPRLQAGYFEARVRLVHAGSALEGSALVISAPRRTYQAVGGAVSGGRPFGIFSPLYALHSGRGTGAGDFGDATRLVRWARAQGASTVGTLPLLATYHDDPEGVSPYSPVSRLAWDELFLELTTIPELESSDAARAALDGARSRLEGLRARALVDYGALDQALAPVWRELARAAFASFGPRRDALERFLREHPLLDEYARFRAARDTRGQDRGNVDADAYRTHRFAQFELDRQLTALAEESRRDGGSGLYLDLPVGTHRAGFDAWRFPETFASGLDTGAPPDALFHGGQNWKFAPAHPEGERRARYRYFIEAVRAHMRFAGVLRVDHVMAMHRLFVMPRGGAAGDGTYLRYRADERWAILAIESQRAHTVVVGEDLGTVPREVRAAMRRHGVGGSYVLQLDVGARDRGTLTVPAPHAVASLNTHDLPPFAGWARGIDITLQRALDDGAGADGGLERTERAERATRVSTLRRALDVDDVDHQGDDDDRPALLLACLAFLGRSKAGLVLVSMSDLLGEEEPQNMPGTTLEHPNWRRRSALALEAFEVDPRVLRAMTALREARARGRPPPRVGPRRPGTAPMGLARTRGEPGLTTSA